MGQSQPSKHSSASQRLSNLIAGLSSTLRPPLSAWCLTTYCTASFVRRGTNPSSRTWDTRTNRAIHQGLGVNRRLRCLEYLPNPKLLLRFEPVSQSGCAAVLAHTGIYCTLLLSMASFGRWSECWLLEDSRGDKRCCTSVAACKILCALRQTRLL